MRIAYLLVVSRKRKFGRILWAQGPPRDLRTKLAEPTLRPKQVDHYLWAAPGQFFDEKPGQYRLKRPC